MEIKDRRIIELFLVLIFISLLLIASLIVLTKDKEKISSNIITNSYNSETNNNYYYGNSGEKVVYKDVSDVVYKKTYSKKFDYSSYGEHFREKDFLGTYIDKFCVYVKNQEYEGNYFKVKFYFEDPSGKEFDESITRYVKAHEEEKICFKEVHEEKYKYWSWNYRVFPE